MTAIEKKMCGRIKKKLRYTFVKLYYFMMMLRAC